MRVSDRYELAQELRVRYEAGDKCGRGRLLDAFCLATGYHRNHAQAVLSGKQQRRRSPARRLRPRRYGIDFRNAIKILWEASGHICAERLHACLKDLMELLEGHGQIEIDQETRSLIFSASESTVERTLFQLRQKEVSRRMTQTKPGTLLRRNIPVIVGRWKELDEPGYVEIDLVSHSGEYAAGSFLNTLSVVDISTGWSERVGIRGKTQEAVEEAMGRVQYLLPFELKGIHPDNGTEFINETLVKWCRDNQVIFARGRPYRKNDNPHVEQKNWTLVRRLIGYERLDTEAQLAWLNTFYNDLLRLHCNCFQPVMKLISKEHVNNHTKRIYDVPETPLYRVLISGEADPWKLPRLLDVYRSRSPLTLKRLIDRTLATMPLLLPGEQSA